MLEWSRTVRMPVQPRALAMLIFTGCPLRRFHRINELAAKDVVELAWHATRSTRLHCHLIGDRARPRCRCSRNGWSDGD